MLEARLRVFRERGLVDRIPTRWQLLQGEIEMTPYVISTDATDEPAYRASPIAHPVFRQALIFAHVGLDHLRTGSALGAKLESLCAHLILTFHQGMPVFDLQVIQTHDAGLARLRTAIDATLTRSTAVGRRRRAIMNRLFRDPTAYLDTYLGAEGYLARAARFDYPPPTAEGSVFPPEFWSLVALVNYSARTFPQRVAPWRLPGRALALARRRFLEGANR